MLVTSTILMKNWRIFKIFRNPTQQKRVYIMPTFYAYNIIQVFIGQPIKLDANYQDLYNLQSCYSSSFNMSFCMVI